MYKTLALVMLTLGAAGAGATEPLTRLKGLADQKDWSGLLSQAQDTPVDQRSPEWEALVIKAARNYLKAIQSQKRLTDGLRDMVTLIYAQEKIGALDEDRGYRADRTALAVQLAKVCATEPVSGCARVLTGLLEHIDKLPHGAARQVALGIAATGNAAETGRDSLPYWSTAAAEDHSTCREKLLERDVGVDLNDYRLESVDLARAQATADACFTELKPMLIDRLQRTSPQSLMHQQLCPVLAKESGLLVHEKKLCASPQ